jgi:hypothetical protein
MERGPGPARPLIAARRAPPTLVAAALRLAWKGNTEWLRQPVGVPDTRSLRSRVRVTTSFRQRQGGGNTGDSNQKMGIGDRWSREYAMERSRPRDHSSRQRTPLRNADCRRAKSGHVDVACVRGDANGPAMLARSTTCYTFIACCTNGARTRSFGQNQSMLPTPDGAADDHVR